MGMGVPFLFLIKKPLAGGCLSRADCHCKACLWKRSRFSSRLNVSNLAERGGSAGSEAGADAEEEETSGEAT